MKIIKQSWEYVNEPNYKNALDIVELAGRVCYKSENNITDDSSEGFITRRISSGHESILEHYNISIKIISDRGFSHELVRHRIASYSMESTRYCNYSKDKFNNEITFILPIEFYDNFVDEKLVCDLYSIPDNWERAMDACEDYYFFMLDKGATLDLARSILPNSTKTEIIITTNIREWRHILKLRRNKKAHPMMRDIMSSIYEDLSKRMPVFFGDI